VESTGRNANLVAVDLVDETMLVGDAPRPVVVKAGLQRLRLADALIAASGDLAQKSVDPLENLSIRRLPPLVVLPGDFVPDEPHSDRSRTVPSPDSSRSIEPRSLLAFAGFRSR
jgi:hypothetical protein